VIVAQGREFGLQRVYFSDLGPIAFDTTVVGRAKDPLHDGVKLKRAEHFRPFLPRRPKRVSASLPGQSSSSGTDDGGDNKKREKGKNRPLSRS
jgi:hypothetical protein